MNTPDIEQAKLNLVTNYFAEDWAIEKAMDLLVDYEKMIEEQQPVPSVASVASKAVLAAIRAANMQLVRTGDDEFMLVTLKKATPQADSVLEDAARVWEAFIEAWRNEIGVDKIVNIMGGADKLKAVFLDAARKQG